MNLETWQVFLVFAVSTFTATATFVVAWRKVSLDVEKHQDARLERAFSALRKDYDGRLSEKQHQIDALENRCAGCEARDEEKDRKINKLEASVATLERLLDAAGVRKRSSRRGDDI